MSIKLLLSFLVEKLAVFFVRKYETTLLESNLFMNAKVGKKLDLRLKVFAFFGKELVLIFAF